MSDVVMTKWECTGCGDGGDGPCTSYGVSAPHACPYGTEENMEWEAVIAPQNIEEAPKTPINTGSPKLPRWEAVETKLFSNVPKLGDLGAHHHRIQGGRTVYEYIARQRRASA